MSVWFTVRLADAPGSLARAAGALAERGVNITGIVGVAEDTDGELMLTTSDAVATREALTAQAAAEFAELATRLLHEAHVVAVPGEAFGTDEHIRLSYAVSAANVDEGLKRMKEFFAKLG